jgi:hypothetical protein
MRRDSVAINPGGRQGPQGTQPFAKAACHSRKMFDYQEREWMVEWRSITTKSGDGDERDGRVRFRWIGGEDCTVALMFAWPKVE